MNILILTDYYPPDKIGGVGEIARNLKRSYEDLGHNVWVLTTGRHDQNTDSTVFKTTSRLLWGVFINNFYALKLIRKYNIDLIHLHQSTTVFFLLAKLFKKFPKIINSFQVTYFSEFKQIHSVRVEGYTFNPLFKEYVEKYILAPIHIFLDFIGYSSSEVVTVVSAQNLEEMQNTYAKIVKKKVYVIPNGIDTSRFKLDMEFARADIEKKVAHKTVLLYAGVFRVRKRVFNLLFALKKAIKQNPDIMLLIVGGGRGYDEYLHDLAKEIGVAQNVIFVGRVPNEAIPYYLSISDIFCLVSAYEGMPVALLEAMSQGKAVITTSLYGMKDLVKDHENGLLVSLDNNYELADAIVSLSQDSGLLGRMGSEAKRHVVNNYQWDRVARKYLDLVDIK